MGARLFVIDGSPAVRRLVEQVSATEGYEVHTFQDGPSALQAAKSLSPRTVVADFHLDKITFSSFCKELGKMDSLSDLSIISLVDSADKVDEKAYRSLGVAVFLTKPLEPGNLIETLRDLSAKQAKKAGASKAKRTWPPITTSTDLEDEAPSDIDDVEGAPDEGRHAPAATGSQASVTPHSPSTASLPTAQVPPAHLETASKTLIDAMAAGVIPQVTQIVSASLPGLIGKEVAQQLATGLDEAIQKHVARAFSPAAISEAVESVVRRELPDLLSKYLATQLASIESSLLPRLEDQVKPLIRQTAAEMIASDAGTAVEKVLPKVVREQIGSIDRLVMNTVQDLAAPQVRECAEKLAQHSVNEELPKIVREQVGSIDRLVVNTVQDLAGAQVREKVDQVVQEMARDRVMKAVREIVPAVAESQVTEELKRLSTLD